ncbi:MAG TPA: transcription-repair coupling factor [Sporichthyaceae bacterium]|jgi:transcription-repair coupling factor (superfamily II helicase)|nr:transcription-repair coupling factor [Sporichthyaceae bacterium]
MSVVGLLDVLRADPVLDSALGALDRPDAAGRDLIAPVGLRSLMVAAMARTGRTVLVVTATGREAEDLQAALGSLLPTERVAVFPSWETLPHERLSPRADTVGRRLAVLRRLNRPVADDPSAGPLSVVLCPVRSLLQPMVPGLGALEPVRARVGDEIELEVMVEALAGAAYSRVDLVERRGEFAVRGGIVDVFPPTEEHPLRVEFWGDTVESIRPFRVADQRSLSPEEAEEPVGLWAPPCRELLLDKDVRARAAALRNAHPELDEMLGKIAEGIAVEGMEALSPVLVDRMELLVDQLPAQTLIVAVDPERVRARAADLGRTSQEFLEASWSGAAVGGQAPIDLGSAALRGLGEVRTHVRELGLPWWTIAPFAASAQETGAEQASLDYVLDGQALAAQAPPAYHGDTAKALADFRDWTAQGWAVVLVVGGHGTADRVLELLSGADLPGRAVDEITDAPEPGIVSVTCGQLSNGFLFEAGKLAVLTETDLTSRVVGATKDLSKRLPSRRKNAVDPLALRPGDYVVHEQHGVGKYVEMTSRKVGDATREYVVIEYAASKRGQPGDRLFVPTDQLEQVTRYVGGEAPALHRLGGADWQKAKGRARKAVKQIAGELIRLYAARTSAPGHAFGPDTPWQRELEDAFGYVETPDQMSAIDDVKADMEKPYPMDRVICGDVGYGKTEIAVRAAFKAVQDGKQVAVLVPTTLLAQQHFSTFSERYSAFPVSVRALSRFTSPSDTDAVLSGLSDGSVDVVIGTHRLLSPQTKFRDLGLIVVDEEQRFGVEHKEKLKALRVHVDVLTMSATPIPRTLEMSISGIREMSTIATPPEERHPVLTFVGAYADKQIQAAIRRELLRDGQVFYVHNRVESIDKAARRLAELVPEARIATAHGQMNEHVLEQVIVDFWERRSDVLVCTTIVETGLDISNANTLIVERADMLGLAQLHQLRGRVGRSRERGYAYFLYPGEKPLTETAHERLATIAQHTELGAGMYVAMKDLEIRGAGNLLGGEQSGHIEGVGFDLYVRMVGEAVAEYKAGPDAPPPPAEVRVELPIDAHIPHDWLATERLRLEAYRRIAAIGTTPGVEPDADIAAVHAELTDRYGPLPEQVENLLVVARFRAHLRTRGVEEVTLAGPNIRFAPVELRESQQLRLQRLYPRTIVKVATRTILVPRPTTARVAGSPVVGIELLDWARELVDAVLGEPAAG